MFKTKHAAKKIIAVALVATMCATSPLANMQNVLASTTTAEALEVSTSEGYLESGYVEWSPLASASGYQVYYKSVNNTAYTQLDDELIRQYSTYYRADILGLKEGTYDVKIVPVVGGTAVEDLAVTKTITAEAQTREGFAFSSESPMGTGSGGYNDDGTVASDAQIIYVTKDTVNTVTLDVITNSKGTTTTCTGLVDILAKRQKGYDKTPLIIRMIGTIAADDITGLNSSGYLQIKGCYNVSLEGVGEDATVYGWGLLIRDAHNVEIKNLGIMLFPDDAISLDTNNENIWVHNNDIFYGTAGSDADQAKGDGSCDVKGYSNYVTVSYNHFWDSGKCSLCGMSDSKEFFVTYHHNWFDHSDSRHPRIRVGSIHVYNNYFDGNSKYGVGVTKGASAFVEANYFRNCKYPMLSSLQGSDVADGAEGTFSSEAGGIIKAFSNIVEGAKRLVYAQDDATEFDAYLATTRDEEVPSTYTTVSGGTTYNNFDTSSTMYEYTADAAEDVEEIVTSYAGRMNGGDFDFEFDDSVDDESYSMNTELMSAIKSYTTDLVSVGGNAQTDDSTATVVPTVTVSAPATTQTVTTTETVQTTETATSTPATSAGTTDTDLGALTSTGMYTNLSTIEDSSFENAMYVAANGSSTGDGTSANPYDLQTALTLSASMDNVAILLKAGTYTFDSQITIPATNSGTSTNYKVLKAMNGAAVTLDFSSETYSSDTSVNDRGIQLNGSYWYIGGITIYGAADNGMMVSGSHNIIEKCILDSNRDTGLQISRSSSSVTNYADWPSYNYIINCTSKNNCDPATYENADGFAAKLTCGDGNVFDGCMSYNNSDDGWDLYAKTATGPIGVVTIRNCIAMRNGMTEDGTTNSNCDGNGFKLGGSGVGTPHVVINCIAIENLHSGFTDNNNPSALTLINCTAFNNNQGGSKNNFSLYRCSDAYVSNCISYTTNTKTSDKFQNLSAERTVYYNSSNWYKVTDSQAVDTSSSSTRGEKLSSGVSASDFVSTSVPAVGTDFSTAWRNADGTINTNGVAMVSSTSTYGTFATDGAALGARFSSANTATYIEVGTDMPTVVVPSPSTSAEPTVSTSPVVSVAPSASVEPVVSSSAPAVSYVPSGNEHVHNFTTDGLTSDYYTITGNLSTSKGTVTYNGLTLTTCLKMESATNISFTADSDGVLTLVVNADANTKSIYVDGTAYTVTNGTVQVSLSAGKHTITKKDSMNLYYMQMSDKEDGVVGSETPATSETPVTSEAPATSETPVTSEVPATTVVPEVSEVPATSEAPATSNTPVVSEVPTTTEPAVTEEVSESPVISAEPEVTTTSPSASVEPSASIIVSSMPSTTEVTVSKPAKVTSLTASTQTTSSITLTWKKVTGASGYKVQAYNSTTKKYVTVKSFLGNTNSYKVTKISGKALTAGTTYKFRVCAIKVLAGQSAEGSYSAVLTTATKTKTPVLTAASGSKKATLSWKKVSGATGYVVYMSTSKSSGYKAVSTVTKSSTVKYTKTGLKKGKTYYFKMRAYKTVNGKKVYSGYSTVKKVVVK